MGWRVHNSVILFFKYREILRVLVRNRHGWVTHSTVSLLYFILSLLQVDLLLVLCASNYFIQLEIRIHFENVISRAYGILHQFQVVEGLLVENSLRNCEMPTDFLTISSQLKLSMKHALMITVNILPDLYKVNLLEGWRIE